MTDVVDRVKTIVTTGTAIGAVLGLRIETNAETGQVDRVKILGFIPLFDRRRMERRQARRAARRVGR